MESDVVTSLYLLCCILRIVKIKDLANTIVAALYYPLESFTKCSEGQDNGYIPEHGFKSESDGIDNDNLANNNKERLVVNVPCSSSSSDLHPQSITMLNNGSSSNGSLRY
jgi:protein CLEC16A